MTHSEMDELYELYVMGVLEGETSEEISNHLARRCEYCVEHLRGASETLSSLAGMVEMKKPPARLKQKVLAVARAGEKKRAIWPQAFALAAAAMVALLFWGFTERSARQDMLKQLQEVSRQRNELRAAVAILSEPDSRTVKFGAAQEDPHGRVFLSKNGGVVFVANHLPVLSEGKTFELWLVPRNGNPRPAGLFVSNLQGIAVNVLTQAVNPEDFAAVAVSVEPPGGSSQPTSKPILIVPLA